MNETRHISDGKSIHLDTVDDLELWLLGTETRPEFNEFVLKVYNDAFTDGTYKIPAHEIAEPTAEYFHKARVCGVRCSVWRVCDDYAGPFAGYRRGLWVFLGVVCSDRRRNSRAPHARDGSCERWLGNVGRVTGGPHNRKPGHVRRWRRSGSDVWA